MATENPLTTRRLAETLRVERTLKLERIHAIQTILAAAGREHLELIIRLGKCPALECDADLVWTGSGEEADVLQAGVDTIERAVLHLIVELHVFFAADHRLVDELIIDGYN